MVFVLIASLYFCTSSEKLTFENPQIKAFPSSAYADVDITDPSSPKYNQRQIYSTSHMWVVHMLPLALLEAACSGCPGKIYVHLM